MKNEQTTYKAHAPRTPQAP